MTKKEESSQSNHKTTEQQKKKKKSKRRNDDDAAEVMEANGEQKCVNEANEMETMHKKKRKNDINIDETKSRKRSNSENSEIHRTELNVKQNKKKRKKSKKNIEDSPIKDDDIDTSSNSKNEDRGLIEEEMLAKLDNNDNTNNEENFKGIFTQMEKAQLKKIKQTVKKRKSTKEDNTYNNEENSDNHESTKKKEVKGIESEHESEEKKTSTSADEKSHSKEDSGIQYLLQWKKDKSNWSFKKVRQTWLLRNMYNQSQISNKHFKILLKYLKELKGKSRDETLAKAKEISEKEVEEGLKEDDAEKVKEHRALEITRILS